MWLREDVWMKSGAEVMGRCRGVCVWALGE